MLAIAHDVLDLTDDALVEDLAEEASGARPAPEEPREELCARLAAFGLLPHTAERMPTPVLARVELLFVEWAEAVDDTDRRERLGSIFEGARELRAVLVALVPLFFDTAFFDERAPTRDLVDLLLIGHKRWRKAVGSRVRTLARRSQSPRPIRSCNLDRADLCRPLVHRNHGQLALRLDGQVAQVVHDRLPFLISRGAPEPAAVATMLWSTMPGGASR